MSDVVPSQPLPNGAKPAKASAGFLRKHAGKLIASVVITAGILFTLHKGGLDLIPANLSFRHVRWWVVPVYLVLLAAMSYFRAVRWRFLLRSFADIPTRRLLSVSFIGFAAILIMPFRIGEVVRPYMIREKGKISLTTATGTVVAERVIDGLFLSGVLAIALLLVPTLHPLPQTVVGLPGVTVADVRYAGFSMLGLFVVAFTVIAVFYFARAWAEKLTQTVVGMVSKKLANKLSGMAIKLADGLHFLGRTKDAVPFLMETGVYWFLNVLGMWVLAMGCGVAHADGSLITLGESCALMGMLGVTILIPGPPGLLGVFHAGIYAGMTMYFPAEVVIAQGAAYTFILYAVQVIWTLLLGAIFLIGDRRALRALEESEGILPAAADA